MNDEQDETEQESGSEGDDAGRTQSAGPARSTVPPPRLTRKAVARVLGLSVATVRRMEERNELHPVTDSKGDHLHDPTEIENIRRMRAETSSGPLGANGGSGSVSNTVSTAGEIAARIFARLDDGEQLTAIVIAEKLDPAIVKRVAEQWRELKEADLNSESVPRDLAELARLQSLDHQQLATLDGVVRKLVAGLNQLQDHVHGPPPGP